MAAAVLISIASSCGSDADRSASTSVSTKPTVITVPKSSTTTAKPTTAVSTTRPHVSLTTTLDAESANFPDSWKAPKLDWSDCDGFECTDLVVPLDWSKPDGKTITLALKRDPAEGDRKGSMLVNPGGPGGSGFQWVEYRAFSDNEFDSLRASYDVLGWDPRGVGASTSVSCATDLRDYFHLDSGPDTQQELDELDNYAASIAQQCADSDGDLLAHLDTDESVRDMEAIRRAIGDDKLTFYGLSYGTSLGSRYAEMFPKNVRAIVLDGVVDPTADYETFLSKQTAAFERAVDNTFSTCGGYDSCPVDDPGAAFDQIAAQLETQSVDTGSGPFGPSELAIAAVQSTYSTDGGQMLISGLADAANGDFEMLGQLASDYFSFDTFNSYMAISCVDTPRPDGAAEWQDMALRLKAISPRLGESVANELLPCAFWAADPHRTPSAPHAKGSGPILVIGNTGDAATPIEQAEAMATMLDNGHLVVADQLGHTALGNSCVDRITAAYLTDLTVPEDGATC